MKAQDFRTFTVEELASRIGEMEREYFSQREAVQSGREKNSAVLKSQRRDIARAHSVLQELRQTAV